jgi:hypothetical protein
MQLRFSSRNRSASTASTLFRIQLDSPERFQTVYVVVEEQAFLKAASRYDSSPLFRDDCYS